LSSDQARPFEGQHHLVNRGWADAEVFLHVGFGWRPAVQARVQVNKGQILALLGREGFSCATHAGHPIQLFVCASIHEEAQMNVRYRVTLTQYERNELGALLSGGKHPVRKLKRAQILLAADQGVSDDEIATSVGVGGSTVYRTKQHFVEGSLERALNEKPRPGARRKLAGKEEALLVATACSNPPPGRARWTLELLADQMVKLTPHESLSRETVRRRLAENDLKPWREKMWCIPQVDAEYVARMEDVLDLYAEEPDPQRPVVCFDESPIQLIGEVRQPIPPKPGQIERCDYEYQRNGTANLFVFLDVNRPWRKIKVTAQRTAEDFAACMRELTDVHYPKAERIRVVLDNLSTHSAGALYQTFPADEARRVLRRLEFHYVPKHASWLNMVEIEISVLAGQCLDRRIDSHARLVAETAAWEKQRNAARARVNWMFTTEKARAKMGRAYPKPAASSGPRQRVKTSVTRN
jgi:transposase